MKTKHQIGVAAGSVGTVGLVVVLALLVGSSEPGSGKPKRTRVALIPGGEGRAWIEETRIWNDLPGPEGFDESKSSWPNGLPAPMLGRVSVEGDHLFIRIRDSPTMRSAWGLPSFGDRPVTVLVLSAPAPAWGSSTLSRLLGADDRVPRAVTVPTRFGNWLLNAWPAIAFDVAPSEWRRIGGLESGSFVEVRIDLDDIADHSAFVQLMIIDRGRWGVLSGVQVIDVDRESAAEGR